MGRHKKTQTPSSNPTVIESIDAIWGIKHEKYQEKTLDEYENKIKSMTEIELRDYSRDFEGISPFFDRNEIVDQLIKLYKADTARKIRTPLAPLTISAATNQKIIDILNS